MNEEFFNYYRFDRTKFDKYYFLRSSYQLNENTDLPIFMMDLSFCTIYSLLGIVFGASGVYDKSYNLVQAPSIISESYKAAVGAAEKSTSYLKFLSRVTGAVVIMDDFDKAHDAFTKGNVGEGAWNLIKGLGTAGFMLFGGEEAELVWNLATLTIDAIDEFQK